MNFDARIQFFMLVFCGAITLFTTMQQTLIFIALALLLLILQSLWRATLRWFLAIIVTYGLFYSFDNLAQSVNMFNIIFFIALKLFPTLIIATSLSAVPVGKLLASLQKIRLPNGLLLTFAITLRFFPVLLSESKIINENAKIRGISYTQLKNWRHPQEVLEYALVPLLMRTIKLADDLSASAATRGIDAPTKKSSVYQIKFKRYDVLAICISIAMLAVPFSHL